jgi:ribonuclease Z
MPDLRVTLLGTGSPIPDPNRAGPASLVASDGTTVLVDAGRGVVMRLAAAGVAAPMLDAVLLTHLHSDHLCGLNDVVTTAWVTSPVARPQVVYGPPGTQAVIDGMLTMLETDIGYRLAHHEDLTGPPEIVVHELEPGATFTVGDLAVTVGRTDHKPVEPTVGYRIESDGQVVTMGGDGVSCATLDDLCAGADIYVQTVVREDLIRPIGYQRFTDILDYHSTVESAAQTAARAGVAKLVLTHMVPAPAPGTENEWRAQAAAHFDGEVILGEDNLVVTVA